MSRKDFVETFIDEICSTAARKNNLSNKLICNHVDEL